MLTPTKEQYNKILKHEYRLYKWRIVLDAWYDYYKSLMKLEGR